MTGGDFSGITCKYKAVMLVIFTNQMYPLLIKKMSFEGKHYTFETVVLFSSAQSAILKKTLVETPRPQGLGTHCCEGDKSAKLGVIF